MSSGMYWNESDYTNVAQTMFNHGFPLTRDGLCRAIYRMSSRSVAPSAISAMRLAKTKQAYEIVKARAERLVSPKTPTIKQVPPKGLKPTATLPTSTATKEGTGFKPMAKIGIAKSNKASVQAELSRQLAEFDAANPQPKPVEAKAVIQEVMPPVASPGAVDRVLKELVDERLARMEGRLLSGIRQILDSQKADIRGELVALEKRMLLAWGIDAPAQPEPQPLPTQPIQAADVPEPEPTPKPQPVKAQVEPEVRKMRFLVYGVEKAKLPLLKKAVESTGHADLVHIDYFDDSKEVLRSHKDWDYGVYLRNFTDADFRRELKKRCNHAHEVVGSASTLSNQLCMAIRTLAAHLA